MKSSFFLRSKSTRPAALVGLVLSALISPAYASEKLAAEKNCLSCHMVSNKLVGPAYTAVAARYADQKGAVEALAQKIRTGGSGAWGVISMPANPQVSAAEAKKLAEWILSLK